MRSPSGALSPWQKAYVSRRGAVLRCGSLQVAVDEASFASAHRRPAERDGLIARAGVRGPVLAEI
jgi:hypothetical protein